jgi:hypothetical protein
VPQLERRKRADRFRLVLGIASRGVHRAHLRVRQVPAGMWNVSTSL